jgi:hypothetical protein
MARASSATTASRAGTAPSAPLALPAPPERARGCGASGTVAAVLLVPGAAVAWWVWTLADHDHKLAALVTAVVAVVIWLVVPAAYVASALVRPVWRRGPLVLTALGVVAAVAGTAWLVRPQAPDGSDQGLPYDTGVVRVRDDVEAALTEIGAGTGTAHDGIPEIEDPVPCVDSLGRSRGAVTSTLRFPTDDLLGEQDVARLRAELATIDPDIDYSGRAVPGRRPLDEHGAHRNIAAVAADTDRYDRPVVMVTTPCLREDG